MKKVIIIFAILLVIGVAVLIFLKPKKTTIPPNNGGGSGTVPPNSGTKTIVQFTAKDLQTQINTMLPVSYNKLVVDGIIGTKTKEAFEYLKSQKASGIFGTAKFQIFLASAKQFGLV